MTLANYQPCRFLCVMYYVYLNVFILEFSESVCCCCSPAYQRTSRERKEGELNFISAPLN